MSKSSVISLILIIISLTILIKLQPKPDPKTLKAHNQTPEYMQGITLYNYDEQGILKNFITANSWEFFPYQHRSIIKLPKIKIYKYPNYIYNITADLGHIIHKTLNGTIELIQLLDCINITHQPYNSKNNTNVEVKEHDNALNLVTSYLEFNPNTQLATTLQPVVITGKNLLVTGTGMNADLNNHKMELYKDQLTNQPVKISHEQIVGEADKLEYSPKQEELTLSGDAKIFKNSLNRSQYITGSQLTYHLKKDTLRSNQSNTIIIQPNSPANTPSLSEGGSYKEQDGNYKNATIVNAVNDNNGE